MALASRLTCLLLSCLINGCFGACAEGSGWPSSPLADDEACNQWSGTNLAFWDHSVDGVNIAQTTDCDKVCVSGACLNGGMSQSAPACGSFLEFGNGCTTNADCGWTAPDPGGLGCRVPQVCKSGKCMLGPSSSCNALAGTSDGGDFACASGTCLPGSVTGAQAQCETAAGWPTQWSCGPLPTPAPTSAAVSGDPIVRINDRTVKIEFPFETSSLVWQDSTLQVFAKADVATPDHNNQWFSDFFVFIRDRKVVHMQQKTPPVSAIDALAVIMYIAEEDARGLTIEAPGKFDIGARNASLIVSYQRKDEHIIRKVVSLKSEGIDFSVVSQNATKFMPNVKKAMQYSHLDINLQRMSSGVVQKGIFAELWGLIPMSAKTARMIKSVRMRSS